MAIVDLLCLCACWSYFCLCQFFLVHTQTHDHNLWWHLKYCNFFAMDRKNRERKIKVVLVNANKRVEIKKITVFNAVTILITLLVSFRKSLGKLKVMSIIVFSAVHFLLFYTPTNTGSHRMTAAAAAVSATTKQWPSLIHSNFAKLQ